MDTTSRNPRVDAKVVASALGGQPSHKGETLKRTTHPDHVIDYLVEHCSGCGLDLSGQPVREFEARQAFDIPPTSIEVTGHRAQIETCPCCQTRNKAAFPKFVNQPVQYGSKVQALVTYLSQYQMLPFQRLKESLEDLFQLSLSEGTVNNTLRRGYVNLQEFDEQSRALVGASNVVHFDETGLRAGK